MKVNNSFFLPINAALIFFILLCAKAALSEPVHRSLPIWKQGYLDIHHINTGRGDATFMVFPDGTTMLFDAGSLDPVHAEKYQPLKVAEAKPDASKRPGQWIASYIKQFMPVHRDAEIDYAVISHFHSDHYGAVSVHSPAAKSGEYRLTGITDVASLVPVNTLIDRAYPDYKEPVDLASQPGSGGVSFANYLSFVHAFEKSGSGSVQSLIAGSDTQIRLRFLPAEFPEFSVRNVKSGGRIWTGQGGRARDYFQPAQAIDALGRFNENVFSLALEISYGTFDYFTGGDMTGLQGFGLPQWFDVETPVAKVLGPVDVLVLNHHGNRDATNANFLAALQPRVIVQQSWISDHPGGEVLHRMISRAIYQGERDLFATNMLQETRVAIGPWLDKAYRSQQGHIVLRVLPGGNSYSVYILDDSQARPSVSRVFGPYLSR